MTAEDWICWFCSKYSIDTDLPEMTKKLPLQVLGHQVLVLSEPNEVKTVSCLYKDAMYFLYPHHDVVGVGV